MIGLRIRQVRELLGWTQTDLASRCPTVSQVRLSQFETGAVPSSDAVQEIADASGFPVDWFLRQDIEELSLGTIRYRKKAKASKREDRQAVRRLEIAVEVTNILSQGLRTPPMSLPYLGAPSGDLEIEVFAAAVRAAFELPERGPIRHLIRSAERAGAVLVGLPVDLGGETPRLANHHGVSAWPDTSARPVIGFSTVDPGDRQRHTVGHEIGHLVMHRGATEPERDYEAEASKFAGALLLPREDAEEAFALGITLPRLAELKKAWGVSIAALVMRAHQIGAIDRFRVESLFKQLSARGWRKAEPVVVHRETPGLIPQLIEARLGGEADWRRIARELALPPHLVRELATVAARDIPHAEPLRPRPPIRHLRRA